MKTRTLVASLVFAVFAAPSLLHAQVNQIGGCDYRSGPSGFDGSEWYQYRNDTGHTINISVSWWDNYNSGGTSLAAIRASRPRATSLPAMSFGWRLIAISPTASSIRSNAHSRIQPFLFRHDQLDTQSRSDLQR